MPADPSKQSETKTSPTEVVKGVDARIKAMEAELRSAVNDLHMRYKTSRYNVGFAAIRTLLHAGVFDEKQDMWEQIRSDLSTKSQAGTLTVDELNTVMDKVDKEILQIMESLMQISKGYIDTLIMASNNKKLTAEILAKMMNSKTLDIATLVDLMMKGEKHKDLIETLKWALRVSVKDERGTKRAVGFPEDKAFKTLTDELNRNGDTVLYAWMILALLDKNDPKTKEKFLINYIKENKKSPDQALAFLEDGNKRGVISMAQMRDVLNKTENFSGATKEQFDQKSDRYAKIYELQNNFMKEAVALTEKSYGSTNDAGDVINLKNTLLTAGQGMLWATIIGNTLVELFSEGRWDIDVQTFREIFTKKYTVGSAIGLAVIHVATKDEQIGDTLTKGQGTREGEQQDHDRLLLKQAYENQWNNFFAGESGNDRKGLVQLGNFIDAVRRKHGQDNRPLPQDYLQASKFREYLQSLGKEGVPLLATFNKIDQTDQGFAAICNAFDHLHIGGGDDQIVKNFDEAVKIAKAA